MFKLPYVPVVILQFLLSSPEWCFRVAEGFPLLHGGFRFGWPVRCWHWVAWHWITGPANSCHMVTGLFTQTTSKESVHLKMWGVQLVALAEIKTKTLQLFLSPPPPPNWSHIKHSHLVCKLIITWFWQSPKDCHMLFLHYSHMTSNPSTAGCFQNKRWWSNTKPQLWSLVAL